jgi:hypothetical protein
LFEVTDFDCEAGFIGETLQFKLPKAPARAIAAVTIGGDDQTLGQGEAADLPPPAADGPAI